MLWGEHQLLSGDLSPCSITLEGINLPALWFSTSILKRMWSYETEPSRMHEETLENSPVGVPLSAKYLGRQH